MVILLTTGLSLLIFSSYAKTQNVSAATDLVADVASYQPSDINFFKSLKNKGVKAVTIKITQGTSYKNPLAAAQIRNAKAVGLAVNVYHYAWFNSSSNTMNNPTEEANFFVQTAKELGVAKDAVLALDIEQPSVSGQGIQGNYSSPTQITNDINTFSTRVQQLGYLKTTTYSMRSWFSSGMIMAKKLRDPNLWVAEYGQQLQNFGVNVGAWQYTSSFVSGYPNISPIDMSFVYDGYLSHTANGFFIIDREYPNNKKAVLTSKDYGLFNTPSPVSGSKLLISGSQLNKPVVEIAAKYKVSNGEYYYNFKYGNRYYWTNTRAFSDISITKKQSLTKGIQTISSNYGFYNTPADLEGSKELISGKEVALGTNVQAIAEYTLNTGNSYYNFKYGNRYYWADTRAFKDSNIVKQESINKEVVVSSRNYGFYNTPATLAGAQELIPASQVPQVAVQAIAKYTLKDGTSYYNFKYGNRYYWADTRAFTDAITITKRESVSENLMINSNKYGFYNTPADLPGSKELVSANQVPQTMVTVIAKYTLSNGTSYYNFKYGDRYYWLDTRAFAQVMISSRESMNRLVSVTSTQYGFYNTPAPLSGSQQLISGNQVPKASVTAIAKYTLSDGSSHYNFKYGNRYYWADTRAFTDGVVIVDRQFNSKSVVINSKSFGFYNTPEKLKDAQQLIAPSDVPQVTIQTIAEYTLSDGSSHYNFKYGNRYYWVNTKATR